MNRRKKERQEKKANLLLKKNKEDKSKAVSRKAKSRLNLSLSKDSKSFAEAIGAALKSASPQKRDEQGILVQRPKTVKKLKFMKKFRESFRFQNTDEKT